MKRINWLAHVPMGIRLERLLTTIWRELSFPQSCAPGHFYSPIPSRREIEKRKQQIFRGDVVRLPEIALRESAQLELLERLGGHTRSLTLATNPTPEARYYSNNAYFFLIDALVFAAMLMEFKPRRYLEIGSGYTSALALDINDRHLGGRLKCSFIEPSAGRLRELLRPSDRNSAVIHETRVQELPDGCFSELGENDFLFIDGSHVSKVGSDLNDVLFRVLPLLQPGVLIHFHDIFWPFEYAMENVFKGQSWNEAYLLRAFLANNSKYRIEFFPSWLEHSCPAHWLSTFPGGKDFKASSFWIRKTTKV